MILIMKITMQRTLAVYTTKSMISPQNDKMINRR